MLIGGANRVSTGGVHNQVYGAIDNKRRDVWEAVRVMSSSDRLREIQDSVSNGDSRLLADIQAEYAYSDVYIKGCSLVMHRTRVMNGALESLMDIVSSFEREMASYTHLHDISILKTVVIEKMREVKSILNLDLGNFKLFAGSKTDTLPIPKLAGLDFECTPEGCFNDGFYKGDHFVHSAVINRDHALHYGVHADNPAFVSLINALGLALVAADANDKQILHQAKLEVDGVYNKINMMYQEVGRLYADAERTKDFHNSFKDELSILYKNLESDYGLDNFGVADRYWREAEILEGAQILSAKVQGMRLSKYL